MQDKLSINVIPTVNCCADIDCDVSFDNGMGLLSKFTGKLELNKFTRYGKLKINVGSLNEKYNYLIREKLNNDKDYVVCFEHHPYEFSIDNVHESNVQVILEDIFYVISYYYSVFGF